MARLFRLSALLLLISGTALADTGLDLPGSAALSNGETIRFRFLNPQDNGLPIYGPGGQGVTVIWQTYPKSGQSGFWTHFFYAKETGALWPNGTQSYYWGAHPFPTGGDYTLSRHDWEIAIEEADYCSKTGFDCSVAGDFAYDRWYQQAFVVSGASGANKQHQYYYDIDSLGASIGPSFSRASSLSNYGDSVPSGTISLSFGDAQWTGWAAPTWDQEEHYGYMRGLQIYSIALSASDVLAEIRDPLSTTAGAANIWYLNLNPTPSDISDKSGNGNDPEWVDTASPEDPVLWEGGFGGACSTIASGSTALEKAANGLAAAQWCQMSPSVESAAPFRQLFRPCSGTSADAVITSWSHEMAWDSANGRFLFAGQGHLSGQPGPWAMIRYTESTNTWDALGSDDVAVPLSPCIGSSCTAQTPWTASPQDSCPGCDGQHAYSGNVVDASGNLYWLWFQHDTMYKWSGGASWASSTLRVSQSTQSMAFHPNVGASGSIYAHVGSAGANTVIDKYDVATSTWSLVGSANDGQGIHSMMTYHPGGDFVWVQSGEYLTSSFNQWKIDSAGALTALSANPRNLSLYRERCFADPASDDKFICFAPDSQSTGSPDIGEDGSGWSIFDLGDNSWTTFASAGITSMWDPDPGYNDAELPMVGADVPEYGVIVWITDGGPLESGSGPGMYAYKHTAAVPPVVTDLTCASANDFYNAVTALNCGETLRVRDSATCTNTSYYQVIKTCTSSTPITITNYPGESPIIDNSNGQNTFNINGSQYLTINGLEITNTGGAVGIAMNDSTNAYITISDNVIHNVEDGIASSGAGGDNYTITGNEIYDTGHGGGTGECMYLGCHSCAGACCSAVSGCVVSNSTITGNYCHDIAGTQGDGIELKCGGYGNTISDNVVEETNSGYAGILVYGSGGASAVNIVERNLVMNCQVGGEGIVASSDAIVRNNIVLDCDNGGIEIYNVAPASGDSKNVTMVNNTVYTSLGSGICLYTNGTLDSTVTIANNALYCASGTAVNCNGDLTSTVIADNYVAGAMTGTWGCSVDNSEYFNGGTAAAAFINPAVPPTAADFWPKVGSSLIDNGNATDAPADDFNATTRTGTDDVGAYESGVCGYNNGWAIDQGFKDDTVACGVCGDGTIDPGEECDDGNTSSGDG